MQSENRQFYPQTFNAPLNNAANRSPLRAPANGVCPASPRTLGFWGSLVKDATVTIVGVSLFCFLATFIPLYFLIAALDAADSNSVFEETIAGDETASAKIVVLPIEGVIETEEYGFLRDAIDQIAEDDSVRGVVLRINSPGGSVAGSDYYYALIQEMKKELKVPVVASMGDVATSGGYYIATAADQIFAERSTLTGSIGVIVPMYDASELCEKFGVASSPVVSGPMKGMGDIMNKPTPEEIAVWQALVDESYEQFLDVVRAGRPWYRGEETTADEETTVDEETLAEREAELRRVADGRIYTARQAQNLRLIDEIGFLDDAIDATLKAAGLDASDAHIVRYVETEDFATSLGLSALAKPSKPIEQALESVATPRGYYIVPRALPTSTR